jgi:hypothetical protein
LGTYSPNNSGNDGQQFQPKRYTTKGVIKQVRRQNKRKQKKNSSVAKEKREMLLQIAAYIRQF